MKYLNWFFIGTALALCLTLTAPPIAQAAANKETSAKVQKSPSKKAAKGSAVKTTAKASKKSKAEKSSANKSKSRKAASKKDKSKKIASIKNKSKKVASRTDKSEKSSDSRMVWMERARESEILTGQASWYGKDFHNKETASGLDYDMHTFTAAHRTLPIGTIVKVTDQKRGKSVMVCVTDRGPYVRGRIIYLSYAAAKKLDLEKRGVCRVNLEVISDEKGQPLKPGKAYFVRYGNTGYKDKVGPFKGFADAAAMHEALRQAHPDAEVVLDSTH